MFTVYEKGVWESNDSAHMNRLKAVKVYDVHVKNGYPYFLICKNGEWEYKSAKYFTDDPTQNVWYDREKRPEVYKDIIVRDTDGKEYDNHYWTGHAYYSYVESNDGSRDGWCSDVDIAKWRYKNN